MKYIMVEVELDSGGCRYVPLIFPEFMVHQDADKWFTLWLRRTHDLVGTTVSAGFYDTRNGNVHGDSETLKLKSHGDDTAIIASYGYLHGYRDIKRKP